MAEAIVSFVVERVGDLLIQEAIFLRGVHGQLEQMQTELKRMQRFLKDADKRQDEEERVKGWISEIRETAYDVEDVIESFALEVASRSQPGFRNKCKRYATIFIEGAKLHKFGNEIKAIKAKITDLTGSLDRYGIRIKEEGEASSNSMFRRQRELRRTYSHLVEEHTVGLERNIKTLVRQLATEGKKHQFVSICGMGGLGKTTLANKVYHHDEVRGHFDCFAWACISQQFQPRDIWEGILIKLVAPSDNQREKISKMRHEEIAKELYQVQQKKKCLVILDDIWSVEAWDALKPAFPTGNATSSKILLTTRIKTVALHVNSRRILEPQCLTEEESWELLQKKVFPNPTDFKIDSNMEELGRKMVERCAGLPLAINVLGGVLASKDSLDEWKRMHEHIDMHLGRGKGHHEQGNYGVQGILALSYYELPYELKPCFLYLSHFQEDYEIPTKELIRLWVAEGFVVQHKVEKNETMEDLAEFYLQKLINRCIVQVGEIGPSGHIKTCRVHDLMRDLCLSVANEDNFFEIVVHAKFEQVVSPEVHRVVVYDDGDETFCMNLVRSSKLRSLLLLPNTKEYRIYIHTLKCFKLLRILILKMDYYDCAYLIKEIGYLVHLRYLAFKGLLYEDIAFPSSIANLRYLQTLVILYPNKSVTLPDVIWKFERLRHLSLQCQVKSKSGKLLRLGNLKKLQTLEGFDTRVFDVNELVNCNNLKKLSIKCGEGFEELEVILQTPSFFNQLSSLSIDILTNSFTEETYIKRLFSGCHHLDKLYLSGQIRKLPEHYHFPPNLTSLTLEISFLKKDAMATLEKLPMLSFLSLSYGAIDGNEIVCSSKGFAQLKTLVLKNNNEVEEWRVEEEAMPNLCQLCIRECSKLKMLPDGLRFITTLRELKIEWMPKSFTKRLQKANADGRGGGGEDLYKVQHVPSILFSDY